MNCEYCGKLISSKKQKTARFCSRSCRTRAQTQRYKIICNETYDKHHVEAFQNNIYNTSIGTMNELIIGANLISKGYEVYKSLSNIGPDYIILKGKQYLRVEVTCGYKNSENEIRWPVHDPSKYDVLALVFHNGTIQYKPNQGVDFSI